MGNLKEKIDLATEKANAKTLTIEEAEKLVEEFPASDQANALLGFVHFQQENYSEAINALVHSLKFGKSLAAWNVLGKCYQQIVEFPKAIESYEQALKINSQDSQTLYNLALVYGLQGKFDFSEKIFKKLMLLQPNSLGLKNVLMSVYMSTSQFEKALKIAEELKKLEPEVSSHHHMCGNALIQIGRKDEAKKSFFKAIEVNPKSERSYYNIAVILGEDKLYNEAIEYLDKVIEINPEWRSGYRQKLFMLYRNLDIDAFLSCVDSYKTKIPVDIHIAALTELVAHQEGKENDYPFCPNPMDYVQEVYLRDYTEDHEKLLANLRIALDKMEYFDGDAKYSGKSSIKGIQTIGNLFARTEAPILELKNYLDNILIDYWEKYKGTKNIYVKDHPLDNNLSGWSTKITKGGYHFSHVHPSGWLSASFCVDKPDDCKGSEGNIEFSLINDDLPIFNKDVEIPRMEVKAEIGKIILFPSSLFHRTIPFESEKIRQAINFDIVPTVIPNIS